MSLNITPFGNNNAQGPLANTAVGAGAVLVPFNTVASGQAAGTTAVNCKGQVTARFRVSFSVVVQNATGAAINGQVQLSFNGALVANAIAQGTVPLTTGQFTISGVFDVVAAGAQAFPATTPNTFGLSVTGNGLTILAGGSNIDIQELDAPTG